MKTTTRIFATLLALGTTAMTQAIPIEFQFEGQVDTASAEPNAFGLVAGDRIFGTAFIPDADLLGLQTYSPLDGSLQLTFDIGNVSFSESQDLGFSDFPTLTIDNGQFLDLNFFVLDFEFIFSAFDGAWAATFAGTDPFEDLTGRFATISVPEPNILALFGMGLLLMGWRLQRRRFGGG